VNLLSRFAAMKKFRSRVDFGFSLGSSAEHRKLLFGRVRIAHRPFNKVRFAKRMCN
jgi:hypothetical protein